MNFISLFKIGRTVLFTMLTLLASLQMVAASESNQQKLVSANTGFAFDLMGQVAQTQPGDDAEFSAMADEPLFISEVKQKSFVDVDETGTEAVAVTTVGMQALSIRREPPSRFEMIVDHPFLFVISDTASSSILFLGVVNDPATGSSR